MTLVFITNNAVSSSGFSATYRQVAPREDNFFAVDTENGIIYKQNRFGVNSEEILFSGVARLVAVDYDPIDQKFYVTDVGVNMIIRANLDGSGQETIASVEVAVPDGLAVDPVSRVVYWTDVDSGPRGPIINVARLDGSSRKIIVNTSIEFPRDIVVQPYQGHVYWSDWGSVAKIERMNGDGTDRTEVVNSELGWPNGIAIDMAGGKLYWADAQLNKIERSNLDGSARELLIAFDDDVHPFGLIFVDNALFWTDWVTAGIDVTDIVNDCSLQGSNGGCEELCLPTPSGPTCVAASPTFNTCPDDIFIVTKEATPISWIPPTVDTPSNTQVTISASHPQSTLFISPSNGTIQVTYTAIDELGNYARNCVFSITALYSDEVAPEVYGCPDDVTREVSPEIGFTFVIWEEPTAIDRVGEVTLTYQSHDVGDVFAVEPNERGGLPTALVGGISVVFLCLFLAVIVLVICKFVNCECKTNRRNRPVLPHPPAPKTPQVCSMTTHSYGPSPKSPPPTNTTSFTNSTYHEVEDVNVYSRAFPVTMYTSDRPPSLPARPAFLPLEKC
ncbi:putative low-density lipoprotein receptor-related protein 2 [Apostichopus japonicus]|uniref:Putative low-density lipoprotein receptor-related protein 2 n=1 Tax=Stichopus japonicus TaxID=307972 RepID=A0A2G8K6V6_STIJA|nr:putative low-density lipoprotein receptor-related protein 2 [Apostichopus japonicus]